LSIFLAMMNPVAQCRNCLAASPYTFKKQPKSQLPASLAVRVFVATNQIEAAGSEQPALVALNESAAPLRRNKVG